MRLRSGRLLPNSSDSSPRRHGYDKRRSTTKSPSKPVHETRLGPTIFSGILSAWHSSMISALEKRNLSLQVWSSSDHRHNRGGRTWLGCNISSSSARSSNSSSSSSISPASCAITKTVERLSNSSLDAIKPTVKKRDAQAK